jgi:hypothetical protein
MGEITIYKVLGLIHYGLLVMALLIFLSFDWVEVTYKPSIFMDYIWMPLLSLFLALIGVSIKWAILEYELTQIKKSSSP